MEQPGFEIKRTRFSAATPGGAREGIGMRGGGKRQLL
jgi:hypothetical protein